MQDSPSTRPRSPVSSRPRPSPSPTRGILPWPRCKAIAFPSGYKSLSRSLYKRRIYMVALSCNPKDCKHSYTTPATTTKRTPKSYFTSLTKKHCGFPVIYYYLSTQNIHEACYSKFTNFNFTALQNAKKLSA